MNRTQQITNEWLLQSGLEGDVLLHEALLRRGFLAYRDDEGVWLGTGSHPKDLDVLCFIDGLEVALVVNHKDRMAQVKLQSADLLAMNVATAIVALPENHLGSHSLWTGWGIPNYRGGNGWENYRKMQWGAKLPTCPMQKPGRLEVNNALDLGVALLVKAFPLARVATRACCDGHGEKPAWISFHSNWNALWGKAVFDVLGGATSNRTLTWNAEEDRGSLYIGMHSYNSDTERLEMLNDIQHFARQLLNQTAIEKIGRARDNTLKAYGNTEPVPEHFAQEAEDQLALEFS